jgi:hypothetical protein
MQLFGYENSYQRRLIYTLDRDVGSVGSLDIEQVDIRRIVTRRRKGHFNALYVRPEEEVVRPVQQDSSNQRRARDTNLRPSYSTKA